MCSINEDKSLCLCKVLNFVALSPWKICLAILDGFDLLQEQQAG